MSSRNKVSPSTHSKSSRIAITALLAALALIFSYVEAIIPMPIAVPGVKLGIANLAVLIALYRFDFRYALSVNLIRIIVSGLLFNGLFGALYAMSGGILGVAHNMGQILVASLLVSDLRMFMYLPVLMFSGIISGIIIGIIAYYVQRSLDANKGASQI